MGIHEAACLERGSLVRLLSSKSRGRLWTSAGATAHFAKNVEAPPPSKGSSEAAAKGEGHREDLYAELASEDRHKAVLPVCCSVNQVDVRQLVVSSIS